MCTTALTNVCSIHYVVANRQYFLANSLILLDVQHVDQPQRDHQEDAQTDPSNNRIQQWRTHQTAAQSQLLEQPGQYQPADGRDQQTQAEAETNSDAQQPGMEQQPCQQAHCHACQYPANSSQPQFA